MNNTLLRLAQFANRKTPWLNRLKAKLGIANLAERILARPLNQNQILSLRNSLHEDIISQKVNKIKSGSDVKICFYVLLVQSIGDIIACEPIVRHLKVLDRNASIHWIVRRNFTAILEANPDIDEIIPIETFSEGEALCKALSEKAGNIIVDCHFNGMALETGKPPHENPANPQITVYTHYYLGTLLSNFSLAAGLPPLDDSPIFHLRKGIKRPKLGTSDFIVFHCRSNEPARDWNDAKWNKLAESLTRLGFYVVELGTKRVLAQNYNGKAIDYTGRRDLQELATIVRDARLFIGVDSAFSHIANCFKTTSLILLGKYKNYDTYLPYSGAFPKSQDFKIIRAPAGRPAAHIDLSEVRKAAIEVLDRQRRCKGYDSTTDQTSVPSHNSDAI